MPRTASSPNDRRWLILSLLCLSVFVVLLDGTIVNVAIPSLSQELDASTRDLQWIVDAYNLVFSGLLFAGGSLGDRYGRRRALLAGLAIFGATSAVAGSVDTVSGLIVARGLMGIGAALIFPATLAILTNVFVDPVERAKAIGIWGAVSGIAVAAGPIVGGALLESFWWGSVFFINVPIVLLAIVTVKVVVPENSDHVAPRLDLVGLGLSVVAVGGVVLTIIEAPAWGWASLQTAGGFAISLVLLALFVGWELWVDHPLMPVRIFRNLRFSAASVAVTSAFFALFGFIFLITQYFQLIRGYGPLEAGVRVLPVATAIAIGSIASPSLAARIGTTKVVAPGLAMMATGFAWASMLKVETAYLQIVGQMVLVGVGLGFTTAPATESIMGSLRTEQAGVGSAVNDTTRELGGTLGVAVVGSVFNSVYVSELAKSETVRGLPPGQRELAEESVGAAGRIAAELGPMATTFVADLNEAFLAGLSVACMVAAGVTLGGAGFSMRFLPATSDTDGALAEFSTLDVSAKEQLHAVQRTRCKC